MPRGKREQKTQNEATSKKMPLGAYRDMAEPKQQIVTHLGESVSEIVRNK